LELTLRHGERYHFVGVLYYGAVRSPKIAAFPVLDWIGFTTNAIRRITTYQCAIG
jgi:hypothetical protein